MVLAAHLLMMGETWDSTASKVGRTHDTIARWKKHELWKMAREAAEERWLYDVKDASRRAVYRQIDEGDGDLALKVLERLDERLQPAKQKVDVGGVIEVQHTLVNKLDSALEGAYASGDRKLKRIG